MPSCLLYDSSSRLVPSQLDHCNPSYQHLQQQQVRQSKLTVQQACDDLCDYVSSALQYIQPLSINLFGLCMAAGQVAVAPVSAYCCASQLPARTCKQPRLTQRTCLQGATVARQQLL